MPAQIAARAPADARPQAPAASQRQMEPAAKLRQEAAAVRAQAVSAAETRADVVATASPAAALVDVPVPGAVAAAQARLAPVVRPAQPVAAAMVDAAAAPPERQAAAASAAGAAKLEPPALLVRARAAELRVAQQAAKVVLAAELVAALALAEAPEPPDPRAQVGLLVLAAQAELPAQAVERRHRAHSRECVSATAPPLA